MVEDTVVMFWMSCTIGIYSEYAYIQKSAKSVQFPDLPEHNIFPDLS